MRVEIWSDVVCPWCFIGKRRFDNAIEVLRQKGITEPIEVVFKAYQLDPSAPVGQPTPVVEGYAKKFGGRERAEQILHHVTNVAAADNIEFNMDIALRANTILAHRALHWALEHHGAITQGVFKERLMKAYFTDGLNVGDADVVAQCATDVNLDGEAIRAWLDTDEGFNAVQEDLQGAAMREITAVPSFVIDDRFLIPGAQDVDVFVNVLERALTR
jgi:predicted DsbA family dithiol-disulfide isomerase